MLIPLLIFLLNVLAALGLGYVLFKDWDDFVESCKGIFSFSYIGGSMVPTRALLWFALVISMVLSSMAFLDKL